MYLLVESIESVATTLGPERLSAGADMAPKGGSRAHEQETLCYSKLYLSILVSLQPAQGREGLQLCR